MIAPNAYLPHTLLTGISGYGPYEPGQGIVNGGGPELANNPVVNVGTFADIAAALAKQAQQTSLGIHPYPAHSPEAQAQALYQQHVIAAHNIARDLAQHVANGRASRAHIPSLRFRMFHDGGVNGQRVPFRNRRIDV